MFSGIVERVGTIESRSGEPAGVRFRVEAGYEPDPLPGASIAVNGVCLTVERVSAGVFDVVAVSETLRRTNLDALQAGSRVNLERALRVGDELGGHWVQGHVDGLGQVTGVEEHAADVRVTIDVPAPLRRYVAEKGSITVDGVSLTVAAWDDRRLTVALVPFTLDKTTASAWRPGTRVNLEVDVVARYLDRLLAARAGETAGAAAPRTEES
jgi:riboflavin synthase alpha subunit